MRVEIVMFDSRMVINSIYILIVLLYLLLALNAVRFVYKLRLQANHHIW